MRFNQKMVAISNCNVSIDFSAFKCGLLTDGPLYMSLRKYAPVTMKVTLLKANVEIKWEEDEESRLMITAARQELQRDLNMTRKRRPILAMKSGMMIYLNPKLGTIRATATMQRSTILKKITNPKKAHRCRPLH